MVDLIFYLRWVFLILFLSLFYCLYIFFIDIILEMVWRRTFGVFSQKAILSIK